MAMNIREQVEYFIRTEHTLEEGRHKSWEYCFNFFNTRPCIADSDLDQASLMLAFYLASWGMYRGSSFLLQYTYTVHKGALRIVFDPRYASLHYKPVITKDEVVLLFELIQDLKRYYFEKSKPTSSPLTSYQQISDTLISKILMGVLGNIPAYDRYAKMGLKELGFSQTMSEKGYLQLLDFYNKNQTEFDELACQYGYPPMKIIDMYLWQVGYGASCPVLASKKQ